MPTDKKPLVSVQDSASMKAYTIGRRKSLKDYIDLYTILKEGYITLAQIIIDANEKYQDAFSDRLFLEQLTYTKDIERDPIIFLHPEIDEETMGEFFTKKIGEYYEK